MTSRTNGRYQIREVLTQESNLADVIWLMDLPIYRSEDHKGDEVGQSSLPNQGSLEGRRLRPLPFRGTRWEPPRLIQGR